MSVNYVYGRTPFSDAVKQGPVPDDITLLELAHKIDVPERFFEFGTICIDGHEIYRIHWGRVIPRANIERSITITFHLPLHGGSLGSVLKIVATIAIIAIGTFISGGALAPLLGSAFAAGTFGAAIAAGVFSAGALLAVAALSPPPSASSLDQLSTPNSSASLAGGSDPTFGTASLTGNVLRPGAGVPRVLGTRRVFPPFAGEALIEIIGDDEYVEAAYILAGPHALTAPQFGGVDTASDDNLTIELQEGLPDSPKLDLIQRQARTNSTQVLLSQFVVDPLTGYNILDQGNPASGLPQWHTIVARSEPDEIWAALSFAEGLFYALDPSKAYALPMRFRMREVASPTWLDLPEVHFVFNKSTPFKKAVKFMFAAMPVAPPLPSTSLQCPWAAFAFTPGQDGSTVAPAVPTFTCNDWFRKNPASSGSDYLTNFLPPASSNVTNIGLYEDRVEFYLSGSGTPFDKGKYEIQFKAGVPYSRTAFDEVSYTISGTQYDLFSYYLSGSTYRIAGFGYSNVHSKVIVGRLSSIWNEQLLPTNDFAVMGVRTKNRSLDQFSILASGYVLDYNEDTGLWDTLTTTSIPTPHYRDVLIGTLTDDPLPASLLGDEALIAWRQTCVDLDYQINAVIEGKTGRDTLLLCASAGFARPRQAETWDVMQDKDRSDDVIAQNFSEVNTANFKWTRAFNKVSDAFLVTYGDKGNNYEKVELLVSDPTLTSEAVRVEAITYDTTVTEDEVIQRAEYDLAQLLARNVFYSFDTDMESLRCRRGDLISMQHFSLDTAAGAAKIREVELNLDGNISSIILYGDVPTTFDGFFDGDEFFTDVGTDNFFVDDPMGVAIRLRDGAGTMVKQVVGSTERTRELIFATPFAPPDGGTLAEDCMITVGLLGLEYKRLIVLDLAPKPGLRAAVTAVDEAPELWPT